MERPLIIFENLRWVHAPFVALHLLLGHEVQVFDFDYRYKRQRWLRPLINTGKVKRITSVASTREHGAAMDAAHRFCQGMEDLKLPRAMARLFGSNEVFLVFQKMLAIDFFKWIYINSYLHSVEGHAGRDRKIAFVPEHCGKRTAAMEKAGVYPFQPLGRVRSYPWAKPLLPLIRAYDKLTYWAVCILYPLLYICLFGMGRVLGKGRGAPVRYRYGIPIDQVFQVRFKGKRSFDMLLDHRHVNKENTVFIVNIPLGKEWVQGQREKGYHILVTKEILGRTRIARTKWDTVLFMSLLRATLRIMGGWRAPIPFLKASFVGVRSFVRWQVVMNHVCMDHYIYSNQEGAGQLATNIILRKMGCRTWNYTPFLGGGYLRARNENAFADYRHILWSFLNSDVFLGMNRDVIEYYRLHYQKTPAYHAIGCIYSGLVRESSNHLTREAYMAKEFPAYRGSNTAKIIAFFDTSFVDTIGGVTTFEDGLGFYQDILRLIQEHDDILVIIKPSKDENYFVSPNDNWSAPENGAKIVRLWETLKAEPRVRWAGSSGDVLSIIGMSDLVATHCMSSPTAEALGARKRAIWYESGQKHRGVMYDQIPGLVAHGYGALAERVDDLLYRVTDREYDAYLDRFVLGRIESHLDGLALTRFRELLRHSGSSQAGT